MTKLSIIIPVYNTAPYLSECLDSILGQKVDSIEIICVDDGSEDDSLEVLKRYKEIKIIQTVNQGSGIARNTALAAAKGDYIIFVDSDDWLAADALETILTAAAKFEPDVLIYGGLTYANGRLRQGSYSVNKIPDKYYKRVFNKKDFKKDIFKFPSTAWTKLYKREFLIKNGIRFQEIRVGQDQIFFIKTMLFAEAVTVLDKNLYCYRKRRPGAVTSAKKKTDFSPIYVFREVEKVVENYEYKYYILNRYFKKAVFRLPKMREDLKDAYLSEFSKLLVYLKQKYPSCWQGNFSPARNSTYAGLKFKYILASIIHCLKN